VPDQCSFRIGARKMEVTLVKSKAASMWKAIGQVHESVDHVRSFIFEGDSLSSVRDEPTPIKFDSISTSPVKDEVIPTPVCKDFVVERTVPKLRPVIQLSFMDEEHDAEFFETRTGVTPYSTERVVSPGSDSGASSNGVYIDGEIERKASPAFHMAVEGTTPDSSSDVPRSRASTVIESGASTPIEELSHVSTPDDDASVFGDDDVDISNMSSRFSNMSMFKNKSFSMMNLQKRPPRFHKRAGLSNGGNVSIWRLIL
jgi:hypothetical protein